MQRASGYEAVMRYFGVHEFDSYPVEFDTPEEVEEIVEGIERRYAARVAEPIREALNAAQNAGFSISYSNPADAQVAADYLEENGLRDEEVLAALRDGTWKDIILAAQNDRWRVEVGNIGTVYDAGDEQEARHHFEEYVDQSISGHGRAGGEEVFLYHNNEIVEEHAAPVAEEEIPYDDD